MKVGQALLYIWILLAMLGSNLLIVLSVFAIGVLASVTGHGILATTFFFIAISSVLAHYRVKNWHL